MIKKKKLCLEPLNNRLTEASSTTTSVNLRWIPTNGAAVNTTYYHVTWKISESESQVGSEGTTQTFLTATGLQSNTAYNFTLTVGGVATFDEITAVTSKSVITNKSIQNVLNNSKQMQ